MEDKKTSEGGNFAVEETPQNLSPMSGESIAAILNKISLAERMIASIREQAKKMLERGIDIPGWKLAPGYDRETIIKPDEVYKRFIALGGKHDAFMSAVHVQKGNLRLALNQTTGARGQALNKAIDAITKGCVSVKRTADRLERSDE